MWLFPFSPLLVWIAGFAWLVARDRINEGNGPWVGAALLSLCAALYIGDQLNKWLCHRRGPCNGTH